MNTYSHLTLLIDSIPLKYDLDEVGGTETSSGEKVKVKVTKLKSTINNRRRSWL